MVQQQVYQAKVQDVDNLRQRLAGGWTGMQQSVIDDATYSTSGAGVSVIACGPKKNILNTHCDSWNSKNVC